MLLNLLVTILNRRVRQTTEPVVQPWEKGNSWMIPASIEPEIAVTKVYHSNRSISENIQVGVSNISIIVTKI